MIKLSDSVKSVIYCSFLHPHLRLQSTSDDEYCEVPPPECDRDHPYFKALNLSPRWTSNPIRKRSRSKDRKSALKKLLAVEENDDDQFDDDDDDEAKNRRDKRSLSSTAADRRASRKMWTTTAPSRTTTGGGSDSSSRFLSDDADGGWSLLEILDASSTERDEESRK